jgi:hypothetical protein
VCGRVGWKIGKKEAHEGAQVDLKTGRRGSVRRNGDREGGEKEGSRQDRSMKVDSVDTWRQISG